MKRILQFVLIMAIYLVLTVYIGWNGWIWLQTVIPSDHVVFYIVLVLFVAYSFLLGQFIKSFPIFKTIGFYWFGFFQYAIILLPLADLIFFALSFSTISKSLIVFWVGNVTCILFVCIFIFGTYNAYNPIIRKYKLSIPKSMNTRKKLRIAVASDMHFGKLSGKSHLKRLVRNINNMNADIILFPGDIVDDHPGVYIKKNMREEMKQLNAPLGVYGVLGNHEYYGKAVPEFLEEMEKSNVRILLDECIKIEDSFYIVGRRDKTERNRKSFENLIADVDKSMPIFAMDHQPFELKKAESCGVDVLFSGHTHRGQMAPNHLITRRMYELDWGYKQIGSMHAIVSSGFGFWGPPLRLGSRSEILQIDLTFD